MTEETAIAAFRDRFQHEGLTPELISLFRDGIYHHYRREGRSFPWRETTDPYHILVSEVMLQQTQTSRVIDKYTRFIEMFPDFPALAAASLREVLAAWQGLGYNRRAIALQKTAETVVSRLEGRLPETVEELVKLPGVGPNTAGAVLAIAFNRPVVYIETNIRSVYHYFFFADKTAVTETDYKKLIEDTLDVQNPREWYYALYDYGAMLKNSGKNTDKPLSRQSRFEGSDRQLRGKVLRLFLDRHTIPGREIAGQLEETEERMSRILAGLESEGFIISLGDSYSLREK